MESSEVCQTGLAEEAELYWKDEQEAALAPCLKLKHVLQRTARDSPDVRFVTLEVRWWEQECGKVGRCGSSELEDLWIRAVLLAVCLELKHVLQRSY